MTIILPTITALPTQPDPTNPSTFDPLALAFVAALPTFRSEINSFGSAVKTQVEAEVAGASAALARVGYPETLRTVSVSGNPTTIDFVNGVSGVVMSSAYDVLEIELIALVLSASTSSLYMRTSTNAGTSWDSSASDYSWAFSNASPLGGSSGSSSAASQIQLTTTTGSANSPVYGRILLYAPSQAAPFYVQSDLVVASSSPPMRLAGAGLRIASADVDGVRLLPSSGNFVSGTINFKGYRK